MASWLWRVSVSFERRGRMVCVTPASLLSSGLADGGEAPLSPLLLRSCYVGTRSCTVAGWSLTLSIQVGGARAVAEVSKASGQKLKIVWCGVEEVKETDLLLTELTLLWWAYNHALSVPVVTV